MHVKSDKTCMSKVIKHACQKWSKCIGQDGRSLKIQVEENCWNMEEKTTNDLSAKG